MSRTIKHIVEANAFHCIIVVVIVLAGAVAGWETSPAIMARHGGLLLALDKFILFVALIGGTILLLGLAFLVLPGPGLPIIAAGVAILATEFLWARRAWRQAKGTVARARRKSGLRAWLRRTNARMKRTRKPTEIGEGSSTM